MTKKELLNNFLTFIVPFSIDRFTKHLAMIGFFGHYKLSFISSVLINRGISLGLFDSNNSYIFFIISTIVSIVVVILMVHTKNMIGLGNSIFGEMLILSGALSNFIDRIAHDGVIDFIILPIGKFGWPGVFNFADICIVIGTLIILKTNFK